MPSSICRARLLSGVLSRMEGTVVAVGAASVPAVPSRFGHETGIYHNLEGVFRMFIKSGKEQYLHGAKVKRLLAKSKLPKFVC